MAMFISGLINNSGYVLVGTAAQSIAHHFGMDNFMSAFNLYLISHLIYPLLFLKYTDIPLNRNGFLECEMFPKNTA